jgi:hypothetical protein
MTEKQLEYVIKLEDRANRALGFVKERTGQAVQSGLTVGAAAIAGYADGRYPDRKILGLDLSLCIGLAAAGYAYTQKMGSIEEKGAMAVANGCFAGFSYTYAKDAGAQARTNAAAAKN